MVYRYCVSSHSQSDDAYDDFANSLAYAAYLLERDPNAAALLLSSLLPAMAEGWYAERGIYPPARAELLRDLAARAPAIAELLRQALHAPDVRARHRAAERLLAGIRGSGAEAVAG